jgi:hypothetical protein
MSGRGILRRDSAGQRASKKSQPSEAEKVYLIPLPFIPLPLGNIFPVSNRGNRQGNERQRNFRAGFRRSSGDEHPKKHKPPKLKKFT